MKEQKIRLVYFGRPLTEEDLGQYAPSVTNETSASGNVTSRYTFFPTIQLIRDLRTIDWLPFAAEQRQVYSPERRDFTKHMVVFENPGISPILGLVPEIILTNSHDGRNSFQFFAGLFNPVTEISYVVNNLDIQSFRIKHQGYTIEQVQQLVEKVVEIIPDIYNNVLRMQQTLLSEEAQLQFAKKVARLRWKEGTERINLQELLTPIRESEREKTLWNLLTIVQEKIVNGGVKYEIHKKPAGKAKKDSSLIIRRQTSRALVNIDQKIEMKRTIWKIANNFTEAPQTEEKQIHEPVV